MLGDYLYFDVSFPVDVSDDYATDERESLARWLSSTQFRLQSELSDATPHQRRDSIRAACEQLDSVRRVVIDCDSDWSGDPASLRLSARDNLLSRIRIGCNECAYTLRDVEYQLTVLACTLADSRGSHAMDLRCAALAVRDWRLILLRTHAIPEWALETAGISELP
jgi:hypothetical protein